MKRLFSFDPGSLLLGGVSLLLCLLLSEALFRRLSFGSDGWSYAKVKSVRDFGESGLLQASEHQDILWELRPNLDTMFKRFPFNTNSRGLRDKDYSLEKPPGTFRVAVIGDSFTMGEGVGVDEIYHSVLEQRLNESGYGRKYEFINFGVAGYSLPQYVSTIRRRVLEYKPDLILIGFCAANDSKRPNLEAFNEPYRVKAEKNGFFHFFFFEHLGNLYKYTYNDLRGRQSGYNADPEYTKEQFRELGKLSASAGVPIVIAYIDNKAASLDYEFVRDLTRAEGFEFIDGTKNFPSTAVEEYRIYLTDRHPNGAANRLFAENIYAGLRSLPEFSGPRIEQMRASLLD